MGTGFSYETDADFLKEMQRLADVPMAPSNFIKLQSRSLRRLVELAKKGATL